jgi:DNA repair protein RAD50
MASVNKLSIRGVRSFSPEDTEQVVEFLSPLTIIVGANGCGKTTIIECLKYAITGALPPGTKSGQSFVHDPRSVGHQQVKASVKLRFTTKADQSMVVVRSMELTQKKTTATFRQLDGVLRTLHPTTGERQSLSHKCTELDRQVPMLMGVSRPILEHVLFCHQEDASWPLNEGAVLKKRFDEIFDSSRYSKAIEVLRKKEKSLLGVAKDIKADLAGLNSHRHAAKGFLAEKEEQKEVLEEIDDTKVNLNRDMAETERQLVKYGAIIEQVDAVDEEIKSNEDELYRQETVVEKQREMLEKDLTATHTLADLQSKIRDFDRTMSTQSEQLKDLEDRHASLLRDIERLRQEEMKFSNDMTKQTMAKEQHQERLRQRYALMEEIAQAHSLDLELSQTQQPDQSFAASIATASMISQQLQHHHHPDGSSQESIVSISPEDMQGFFQALQKKKDELAEKLTAHKRRANASDDEMQKVLQDLNGKKLIVANGAWCCLSVRSTVVRLLSF